MDSKDILNKEEQMNSTDRSPFIGDLAPDFTLPAIPAPEFGVGDFQLSDNLGADSTGRNKGIVLFFYPKDNTSGCTKEAIAFTESFEAFDKANIKVVGISPDPIKMHTKFMEKHSLNVILVSDEERTAIEAYSVWVEKSMYGRKYMGVERSTFLINSKGEIAKVWRKVKVAGHVEEVLEAAKGLN